jgi:hypothetical protein
MLNHGTIRSIQTFDSETLLLHSSTIILMECYVYCAVCGGDAWDLFEVFKPLFKRRRTALLPEGIGGGDPLGVFVGLFSTAESKENRVDKHQDDLLYSPLHAMAPICSLWFTAQSTYLYKR